MRTGPYPNNDDAPSSEHLHRYEVDGDLVLERWRFARDRHALAAELDAARADATRRKQEHARLADGLRAHDAESEQRLRAARHAHETSCAAAEAELGAAMVCAADAELTAGARAGTRAAELDAERTEHDAACKALAMSAAELDTRAAAGRSPRPPSPQLAPLRSIPCVFTRTPCSKKRPRSLPFF